MGANFLNQLLVSTPLILLCLIVHGYGLAKLIEAMRQQSFVERTRNIQPLSRRGTIFTFIIVMVLVVLHSIEIIIFALAYLALGAVPDLEGALYFSSISYTTTGFSDELIDPAWRLIPAFEGIVGVLLLGLSTAFFIRVLTRLEDFQ